MRELFLFKIVPNITEPSIYLFMRLNLYISCVILTYCLLSCKKGSDDVPSEATTIDELNQSVVYKTVATVPSPADSAKGSFKNSVSVFRKIKKDDPNFLTNIPHVSSSIIGTYGLNFSYNDPNKSLAYFMFTADAFPNVRRQFELNKTYEHTTIAENLMQKPLFLGSENGFNGMNYFVDNVLPPDADYPPISRTYSTVTFTKKIKIPLRPFGDTALFASGHIAGYCIEYYKKTDTAKYRHRWDFTVDFTDLKIDR